MTDDNLIHLEAFDVRRRRESEDVYAVFLRYVPEPALRSWTPPTSPSGDASDEREARRLNRLRARNDTLMMALGLLHSEGAPLLLGTDTPNPFVVQGFSIHQELQNFVRAGLSPYQALCCGTTGAARFLGESHLWGTVAPGKRADLLLLSEDPLNDVDALRHLETVFVNGIVYARADLDNLLTERLAATQPGFDEAPAASPTRQHRLDS